MTRFDVSDVVHPSSDEVNIYICTFNLHFDLFISVSFYHVHQVEINETADDVPRFDVGDEVAKVFVDDDNRKKLYRGSITDMHVNGDVTLYSIVYEDGDGEDMSPGECKDAVNLFNDLENGVIDEWEIGDE